ncbi:YncE family protein, partial [Pseudomonas sp. SID14000]|uniref:YncE family protein n=1 Tax=Pseudomonas sp. SID14000 TaxID=1986221 RepID=UPI0034D16B54
PSGTRAYVADAGSDDVKVINTATNTVTATVPVGDSPARVEVNPSGTAAYATSQADDTVSVISTGTNAVTDTISGFTGPYGIAVGPLPRTADIDVNLTAQPHLCILVPYLSYTLTADNTGPDAVTSPTLTSTL